MPASIPPAFFEIEKEVKHDVIAFTTAVAESMQAAGHAEASRWLHYGLTSNDVVDTAQALQIRQACGILLAGLERLQAVLKRRAFEFKDTVQIGRTHGVHAEPITFGLKLAIWYGEAGRNLARLRAAPKICAWARSRAPWGPSRISARKPRSASARGWI
jgi:adenylosuccinate lyase